MIAQGAGKIVNMSSQAGVVGLLDHGAYSASKGGLTLPTKVMAAEWGRYNIQVNAIAPTVILTPMGTQVWGDPVKADPMLAKIITHGDSRDEVMARIAIVRSLLADACRADDVLFSTAILKKTGLRLAA